MNDKILLECSLASVKRFIRLYLSLKETPYWYHQVLSFKEQIEDAKIAKRTLKKFLDSMDLEMQKYGEMGVVYVMGRQSGGRIHFHLILLFYGSLSLPHEKFASVVRQAAWKRWCNLNEGVKQVSNGLKIQTKPRGLNYLLQRHVDIAPTKKESGKPNWFGTRNGKFIKAHSIQPTKAEVEKAFGHAFPLWGLKTLPPVVKSTRKIYTKRDLEFMKAYAETSGVEEFDSIKHRITGRKGKVSDSDFLDFLNGNKPSDGL